MKKNQRGFTLMELMIVIVIIGVLAAIGVPAYRNYVTQAKESACSANRNTIATALGMYYAEHGVYTNDFAKLADYVTNIDAIKECPAGGDSSTYTITVPAAGTGGNVTVTCPNGHDVLIVGTIPTP